MRMPRSLFRVAVALCLVLLHFSPATSQAQDRVPPRGNFVSGSIILAPRSYQRLQDDPQEFRPGAEWEVQGRLQAMQQLREMRKNALVNKLRGLSREQLQDLQKRLQSGQQMKVSPEMQELLKKLTEGRSPGGISRESLEALGKMTEKPSTPQTSAPPPPDNGSPPPQPGGSSPDMAGTPAAPSTWDRFQEDAARWVRENMREAGSDLADAVDRWQGASQAQAVRELFSGKDLAEGGLRYRLAEQAQGLAAYLPRLDLHMPRVGNPLAPFRSLWTNLEPPRLGGFSAPSARGGTSSSMLGDWAFAVVFGVVGALLLFLVGRHVQLRQAAVQGDESEVLGPWPVTPQAIATREQLVRAFDYLALLTLGMQARSCHHLDVAAQLGLRGGDLAHEQAAESLARLYEQARYAPASEPLSPDELAAARRHLSFLAGVTAP